MLTGEDDIPENICPDCARYLKENTDLKEAFIDADYENVLQCIQLKDVVSYAYRLLEDTKAEIERLKAELCSRSQSKKKVLEKVGHQKSNTMLRATCLKPRG